MLLGVSLPTISAIVVAILQYGPTWKPLLRESIQDGGPTGKKLNYYIAHLTLDDVPGAAANQPNVSITFNIATSVYADDSRELFYKDRIQAGGGIEYAKSVPPLQILNPTQYPASPTLLEFRINPIVPNQKKFELVGIASVKVLLTPDKGKFGPHLPLNTDLAMVTVDCSHLTNFHFPQSISACMEGRDQQGGLQYGVAPVIFHNWMDTNKTMNIVARDLPVDSSLIFHWGK